MTKLDPHNTTFDEFHFKYTPLIEHYLKTNIPKSRNSAISILSKALEHSLLNGGKRIRPLLSIASNFLFSNKVDEILPLACACEIIHTYGLVHDDLPAMDDDTIRRGKPTCHVEFGEDIAILTGDALNTLAFELLSTQLSNFNSSQVLKIIQLTSRLSGIDGVIGGQVLDIKSHTLSPSLDILKELHKKKTGALITLPIVGPAILHNVDPTIISSLYDLSDHVGLLFQIIDDILDVEGDEKTLGKTPGKDAQLNKLTYPLFMSMEKAKEKAQDEKQSALSLLEHLEKNYNFNITYLNSIVKFIASRSY